MPYDYDLESAFPKVARDLVDIRQCEWEQSSEYRTDALYGYCKGGVTINPGVQVSPIIYTDERGNSSTPVGSWTTHLCKSEIDFIRNWKIGEFKIESGWWAIPQVPESEYNYPLRVMVDQLLSFKTRSGLQGALGKRMAVGVYGKMGEQRADGFGPHFNPCYFAEISTRVRLQVAEFVYTNHLENSLIHVSVDGVLTSEEIKDFEENNNGWKLSESGPALVVSSGTLFTLNKRPQGIELLEMLDLIRKNESLGIYTKPMRKVTSLGEALQSNKFEMIGKVRDTYTTVNLLGIEHDRYFRWQASTGKQLLRHIYKSRPRVVGKESEDNLKSIGGKNNG